MRGVDLNLLRLFDAVYRTRSVTRAAEQLGLSQPATSQALSRLRRALGDPLFERVPGGVRPTQRAERLAPSVQAGLALMESGLDDAQGFDPRTSTATLRLRLTDIGEARFLPALMAELERSAPGVRVQTSAGAHDRIEQALDDGSIHFAIGHLPQAERTAKVDLVDDRYVLVLRADHPRAEALRRRAPGLDELRGLDLVAVPSHLQSARLLHSLGLDGRVRLQTSTFLALPAVVRRTDLAVVMPQAIADALEPAGAFCVVEPRLPAAAFTIALHWSHRHARVPMLRWARELLLGLFERPALPARRPRGRAPRSDMRGVDDR